MKENCKWQIEKIPCLRHWSTIRIRPDGGMHPCCFHPALANLGHGLGTMEAFNSPAYHAARARVLEEGYICQEVCSGKDLKTFDPVRATNAAKLRGNPRDSAAYRANRDLLLSDIADGRTEVRAIPPHVILVSTRKCNLRCPKCFQEAERDKGTKLGYDPKPVFDWVLRHEPLFATCSVQGGEVFCDKATVEFLRRCADLKAGFHIHITTNGTLLHKYWDILTRLNLSLTISLDSFRLGVYPRLHPGGDLNQTWENLTKAASLRMGGYLKALEHKVIVQEPNFVELPDMAQQAIRLGFQISYMPVMIPANPTPEQAVLSIHNHERIPLPRKLEILDEALTSQPEGHGRERLKAIKNQLTRPHAPTTTRTPTGTEE